MDDEVRNLRVDLANIVLALIHAVGAILSSLAGLTFALFMGMTFTAGQPLWLLLIPITGLLAFSGFQMSWMREVWTRMRRY